MPYDAEVVDANANTHEAALTNKKSVVVESPQANVQTKKSSSNIFKKMFSSKKQQQQQQNATNTPSPRPRSKSEVGTAPSTARRLSFNFFGAGKNKNKADNGPDSILRSGRRRSSTHFGDPTYGEADEPRKSEDDDTFRRTLKRLLAHGGAPQDILNLLAEKDFDGAAFGNALLTCANQQVESLASSPTPLEPRRSRVNERSLGRLAGVRSARSACVSAHCDAS